MLENEEQSSTYSQRPLSPAEFRVTAEEFTAAVGRIEARRAAETAHRSETIEIGTTLHELHIDATADEVLREVERLRAAKVQEAAAQPQPQPVYVNSTRVEYSAQVVIPRPDSIFGQLRSAKAEYRHARKEQIRLAKIAYRLDREDRLRRLRAQYLQTRGRILEPFWREILDEIQWAGRSLCKAVASAVKSIQRSA